MKKLLVVLMLLALTASISFAMPITVQVTKTPGTSPAWFGGGEFTVTPVTGLSGVLNNYHDDAKFNGGFQSFCLETQEHPALNVVSDATLSTKAIEGGVGPAGDPISKGTAFLYYNFSKGALAGYDYTAGAGREYDAYKLQQTIWWLEEENPNLSESTNKFGDLVKAEFGSLDNARLNNDGLYSVSVLNMTVNRELEQSMLVTAVVPAPGALLLAGMGVSVVGWLRRKQLV